MTSVNLKTIYLVRHCHYKNPKKVIPFRLPGFPLSQKGEICANKLKKLFLTRKIDQIYSSPILRAKQTAQIIGKAQNITPIFSSNIIETKSPFQGAKRSWFDNKGGDTFMQEYHYQNRGESIKQVFKRSLKLITKILNNQSLTNTLIVSHGDPIMLLIYGLKDKDPKKYLKKTKPYIPMGGVYKLTFKNKKLNQAIKFNY